MLKKFIPHGLAALLISAVVLSGCGGGKSSRTSSAGPTVYVGGYYTNKDGIKTVCYWDATGKRYDLDLGDGDVDPNWLCLSFSNNELQLAGCFYSYGGAKIGYFDSTGRFNYQYDLDLTGTNSFSMKCGFVYNGQVYTGGCYVPTGSGNWLPCYWDKDGRHALSEDDGNVGSVFVDGSGVYAAGRREVSDGVWRACYWKKIDGEPLQVYDISTGVEVSQIVVDNDNTVYMSGKNLSGPCYWVRKSGGSLDEKQLDGAWASSIFVSNSQVYVGGYYYDSGNCTPCYWDGDGNRHKLANPDSDSALVNSIFVYNNKVYAAGGYADAEGEYACYWDDTGKRHRLDVGDSKESDAKRILVR